MKTLAELDAELELSKTDFTAAYIAREYRECAYKLERELAEARADLKRKLKTNILNAEVLLQNYTALSNMYDEAKAEIARLRAIPLPAEPHESDPAHRQWHVDVQHYESYLREQK